MRIIALARIDFGFVLNPLTSAMTAMVTFVGSLIFIYSAGYMSHDKRMARFFCYLSLFASGMLGVVLAKRNKRSDQSCNGTHPGHNW